MLRFLDISLSLVLMVFTWPVFVVLTLLGLLDTGSPFFVQERVGWRGRPFKLVKFRTMRIGTASVASHLASADAITPYGRFLRRTKLDELPQLWNVLAGDMSLVGPRPCLFSQRELIEARRGRGVLEARPGVTGLAQVKGIDMSEPQVLAEVDAQMLASLCGSAYFRYLLMTITGMGQGDRVRPD